MGRPRDIDDREQIVCRVCLDGGVGRGICREGVAPSESVAGSGGLSTIKKLTAFISRQPQAKRERFHPRISR